MTARPVAQSMFPDLIADKPVGPLPLSVQTGTNADLIYNIRDLYLGGSVLDVTYGQGKWWDRFTPDPFTFHDLALDGVDFRALPEADRSFDAVCFDPPYVLHGRTDASGVVEFADAYGLGAHASYDEGQWLGRTGFDAFLSAGFTESARVADSWLLVKCMEFAQNGRFHDIPSSLIALGSTLGLTLHDRIVHNAGTGPGGHNIWEAKRCRRAHSYLLVFQVPA